MSELAQDTQTASGGTGIHAGPSAWILCPAQEFTAVDTSTWEITM